MDDLPKTVLLHDLLHCTAGQELLISSSDCQTQQKYQQILTRLVALHCWTKAVEGKEEDHDVSDVDEDNWKE